MILIVVSYHDHSNQLIAQQHEHGVHGGCRLDPITFEVVIILDVVIVQVSNLALE
jgi:hypothetical protein